MRRSNRRKRSSVFWDRHDHYTKLHTFTPIVTSLLNNHYHEMGYQKVGDELAELMRKLHGSIAKLVNDVLEVNGGVHRLPFWGEGRDRYFDGCLRDELQFRRTYRYVLLQAVRGVGEGLARLSDTRVGVELEVGLKRALSWGRLWRRFLTSGISGGGRGRGGESVMKTGLTEVSPIFISRERWGAREDYQY